jgi:TatD DNase family protein
MIITGTNVAGSQEGVQIAGEYPGRLFATAGVHPHDSRNCTEATLSELRHLATHKEVVAIGECGLDFNRDFSPRPQQEKWLEAQVALAEELQIPLFLHERDARQRFCDILATVRKSVPAVLHCFTGIREDLKTYLNMGLHIGITGWICDERRGMHLRELVKDIPLDRVASASVRDGISAAAVVFAPDYGSEDDHQIRPHLFSRDCAGSTSPDSLAPAA